MKQSKKPKAKEAYQIRLGWPLKSNCNGVAITKIEIEKAMHMMCMYYSAAVHAMLDREISQVAMRRADMSATDMRKRLQKGTVLEAYTTVNTSAGGRELDLKALEKAVEFCEQIKNEHENALREMYQKGSYEEAGIPFDLFASYIDMLLAELERHRDDPAPPSTTGVCPGGCLRSFADPLPHCPGCAFRPVMEHEEAQA